MYIKEISLKVEKCRDYLQKLMDDKKEYTCEEILCASRTLDILINEYNLLYSNTTEYLYTKALPELSQSFPGSCGYSDTITGDTQ